MPAPVYDSFHVSLLAMASAVSFSEASAVIGPLHEKGMVNWSAPVPHGGRASTFAHAWLAHALTQSYRGASSLADLRQIEAWTGDHQWLGLTNGRDPDTLFDAWMAEHTRHSRDMGPQHLPFLTYAPMNLLETWKGLDRHAKADPGALLLSAVLRHQTEDGTPVRAGYEHTRCDFIPLLAERGLRLTGQVDGRPVAAGFTTPAHWDLYLAQGGDPQAIVPGVEGVPAKPLWKHLGEEFHAEALGKHISQKMTAIHPEMAAAVEQADLDQYWRQIRRSRSNETASLVRSRKNWPELRTKDGENVFMVLAQQGRWQVIKALSAAKISLPLWTQTDGCGRGLWFHLLNHQAPEDIQKVALTLQAPMAQDSQGRGYLLQLDWSKDTRFAPDLVKTVLTPTAENALADPALWIAGPEEEQERVRHHFLNVWDQAYRAFEFSNHTDGLSRLAKSWTKQGDVGPAWRAVLCVNEICRSNPDYGWIDAQIEQGVELRMTPERAAELGEWLTPKDPNNASQMRAQQRAKSLLRQMKTLSEPGIAPRSDREARLRVRS